MRIIPVILSGGSGTRLWPLSRKQHPKQYLSLSEEQTMLQATINRLNGIKNLMDPIIVCNKEHRFLVAEQIKKTDAENIKLLLEPIGKNTAPAITAAAIYLEQIYFDTRNLMLILSADHIIEDIEAFHEAINVAVRQADERSKLVTFGVSPTEPNTGYGYIKMGEIADENFVGNIEKFIEKPDLETAVKYLKDGSYYWNSGMFVFDAEIFLKEMKVYSREIVKNMRQAVKYADKERDFVWLEKTSFQACHNEPIDCALMEKTENSVMVPLNAGWSDVGSWSALYDVGQKNEDGNVIKGDVVVKDTFNSYINADHHMVVTIGVENLVVVDTPDSTLIANKDEVYKVKEIVEYINKQNRCEQNTHRKVYRPWGAYDTIDEGENFKVKRIIVSIDSSLSLQKHNYRSEHWIVVKGKARVTCGEAIFTLNKNESTYIPIKAKHRIENVGEDVLELIEVQTGSYFGEDDIERFDDKYGRVKDVVL
jgi:mannose-1-phosphate guanylyltransferase/mannose-6-phosphate isomerase